MTPARTDPGPGLTIRPGVVGDGPAVIALMRDFAIFERLPPPDDDAAVRLLADAFGPTPRFDLLVAEVGGRVQAYAIFFATYSTFRARPSLFLEDLFVHPAVRRRGIGRALMRTLARIALERGCARFEWAVLEWNEVAQHFYHALGATISRDWWICGIDGAPFAALGASAASEPEHSAGRGDRPSDRTRPSGI